MNSSTRPVSSRICVSMRSMRSSAFIATPGKPAGSNPLAFARQPAAARQASRSGFGQKEGAHAPPPVETGLTCPANPGSIDRRDATPVLGIGRVVGVRDLRPLLAVADRLNAAGRDAERDQHVLHGLGTTLAEREVVLAGAALVTMPLDRHGDVRITAQPFGLLLQGLLTFGLDVGLVVIEEHAIAGGGREILLGTRSEPRAADPARAHRPARPGRRFGCVTAGAEQCERAGDSDSDKTCKHR